MQRSSTTPRYTANQVRAVFQASAAFFNLPATATRGDLAERVSKLGDHQVAPLNGIDVMTGGATPGLGTGSGSVITSRGATAS